MQLGGPRTASAAMACAALVVSGCGVSNDVMATIGMPPSESAAEGTSEQTFGEPPTKEPGEQDMVVTPAQHAFLDALAEAGIKPANELSALSIGSYVCQARAAKQSDQVVWDFVLPMVRGDVKDSYAKSVAPPAGQVDTATADYIRIATETLC